MAQLFDRLGSLYQLPQETIDMLNSTFGETITDEETIKKIIIANGGIDPMALLEKIQNGDTSIDKEHVNKMIKMVNHKSNPLIEELWRMGEDIECMQISHSSIYLTLKINDKQFNCLLDTGAATNIMDPTLVEELGLSDYVDYNAKGIVMGIGTGEIKGMIPYIEADIDGLMCQLCFTITSFNSGHNCRCILGLPFMLFYQTSLNFENRTIKIQGVEKKLIILE